MNRNSNTGFVLLETLLIAMIVSFTAISIMKGFHTAFKVNHSTALRTVAIYLANAQMAELQTRAVNDTNFAVQDWYGDSNDLVYDEILGTKDIQFTVTTNLNKATGLATVNISWNIGKSDEAHETIEKIIWIK